MLTTKQLNTKIAGVRKSTAALRQNIHEILCNAAAHAYIHGDVTAFTRLFNAVAGTDRHSITKWVHEYGFAKLDAKTGAFTLNKAARKSADFVDGDAVVEYLMDNVDPWYAFVKSSSQVASDLDVEKQVQSLIKRIKKAKDTGDRGVVIPFGTRKALAELDDLVGSIRDERNSENTAPKQDMRDVTPTALAIAAE